MRTIGTRVGAILGAKDKVIEFLGFGIYEGDFVPAEAAGWMAEVLVDEGATNPRIRLDSGEVVYGCECWWGPEGEIRRRLDAWVADQHSVVDVSIADVRARNRALREDLR